MYRFTVFTVFFVLVAFQAIAANWASQISGLDGVAIACANANKEKYAARICKNAMMQIETKLVRANIPVVVLGSYFVKSESAPPKPDSMAYPLNIVVFIRGAHSGNIHAIDLRSRISVTYKNAVEAGHGGNERSGELILWEGSTTGAGLRNRLTTAITKAALKKIFEQLTLIIAAWPRVDQ